ncbi:putative glycosyl hydrolase [Actinoplanes missouriensis 431]|uniref:Exo-alpha-(1->6)-L-arabinopyranosidase n=1 Tax=Actinoplanes missouriensis (strain ATCC 14538 / DSM 43046 / CBS 188.64 / JCM 3121 / NBRC 102363 / NCIMB 12654 / NRRL B-3342 / UNCC 431) TaxID=512565 RepID=I0H7F8_ACTM4|nr:glycoside hydrolase family 3 protein [Actinoplanes missouriensis]BAL88945.1 putative glycosyl hydrolase [Actinoplanes missouriensis 431]
MRKRGLALLAAALLAAPLASTPAHAADPGYPFRDPALPLETRVDDLVGRLTLDEKISLLHQYQPAIPRLGLGVFKSGTEALHGVAWSNSYTRNGAKIDATATVFPQAVGLASTWDQELLTRVGAAVGDELRGFHAQDPVVWGLNTWAPVVNLLRDPRWGRNEEGYSEDPLLSGAVATAYGKGLQGPDPDHLKTAPTLKHYAAYNNETKRDVTSSNVPQRVLNEYDRAPFKAALENDAATGVMASYNLINGRPATVDRDLETIVRDWSDRRLYNVSDAWAPTNLTGSQAYYATQAEANAAILKAGLDSFTVNDTNAAPTVTAINEALQQRLLTEAEIDESVGNALSIRFRLGEFDPDGGPHADITPDVIDSPAHRALARETAAEAAVLLKNDRSLLPLKPGGDVAVVGPLADKLYSDWYGGQLPYEVTVLDGVRERAKAVTTSAGADRIALKEITTGRYLTATDGPAGLGTTTATTAAQFDSVDWGDGVSTLRSAANGKLLGYNWGPFVTVEDDPTGWYVQQQFRVEEQPDGTVVLRYAGYETQESWFGANTYVTVGADGNLALGAADAAGAARFDKTVIKDGVREAADAARRSRTAVVVVGTDPFVAGREVHDRTSLGLGERQEDLIEAVRRANPNTVVVLQSSYPQSITWAQRHVPGILWTTHAGAETGHAVADVLFGAVNPSGRLTQTWPRSESRLPEDLNQYDIVKTGQTYLYSDEKPLYSFGHGLSYTKFRYGSPTVKNGRVSVTVTNTGSRAGDEVVQLYTRQRTSRDVTPRRQLRGFQKVHLGPGRSATVTLDLDRNDLARWDVTRQRWVVENSVHDILLGSSSSDIRARATLAVRGETIPARALTEETRSETFDDYQGVRLLDETKERGTVVGASAAGDWIAFKDAALRGGRTLTVRASGAGTVEVRLGSPSGRLLGTATVSDTGGIYRYVSATAPLTPATGRHDVYLVPSPGLRLATFSIT